jgi:hypothetical protein
MVLERGLKIRVYQNQRLTLERWVARAGDVSITHICAIAQDSRVGGDTRAAQDFSHGEPRRRHHTGGHPRNISARCCARAVAEMARTAVASARGCMDRFARWRDDPPQAVRVVPYPHKHAPNSGCRRWVVRSNPPYDRRASLRGSAGGYPQALPPGATRERWLRWADSVGFVVTPSTGGPHDANSNRILEGHLLVSARFLECDWSAPTQRYLSEIRRVIDIRDQPRLFRPPAELRAGACARGRSVNAREHREPAEVLGRLGG